MVTISKVLARVAAGSLNYFGAQNYAVLATRLNIARLLKLDSLTKKIWRCDGTRCIIGLRFLLVL